MHLLCAVLAVFSAVHAAGALRLISEDGERFSTSAWIKYDAKRKTFPQCCQDTESCDMVRLSNEVIADVKNSDYLRSKYESNSGKLEIEVAYDSRLGGISGTVYLDGYEYLLEPLNLKERRNPPCYVKKYKSSMNLYHKLTKLGKQGKSGSRPQVITLQKQQLTGSCCKKADICMKAEVNLKVLSVAAEITLPLDAGLPAHDGSESFRLGLKLPQECSGIDDCDAFYFRNTDSNLLFKINNNKKKGLSASLSTESNIYNLKKCGRDYVWTRTSKFSKPAAEEQKFKKKKKVAGYSSKPKPVSQQQRGWGWWGAYRTIADSSCWYNSTQYCSIQHHEITSMTPEGSTKPEMALFCNAACLNTTGCTHWTMFMGRGVAKCYLLDNCVKIRTAECLVVGNCISGDRDCTPAPRDPCVVPPVLDPKFTRWQCTDDFGENIDLVNFPTEVPFGTICVQRCATWVTQGGLPGYLESHCINHGEWTETAPHNNEASLAVPPAPYSEPDDAVGTVAEPLQTCSCEPLKVTWPPNDPNGLSYDPNDEEGNNFICDVHVTNDTGEFIIEASNECRMFCDNNLFVTVMCKDGEWTGNPDQGFWCWTRPYGACWCMNWATWGAWSTCTATGSQTRTRTCAAPTCSDEETQSCAVDGNWSTWGAWGACDPATGKEVRTRTCDNPGAQNGGADCPGDDYEEQDCPVDGNWGTWGAWGTCDPSTGKQERTRVCDNPAVLNNGADCPGDSSEEQDCAVDGGWCSWTAWGACDSHTGEEMRTRDCLCPAVLNGGAACAGNALDIQPCDVDGNWGEWSDWSTCDPWTGIRERSRDCDDPAPLNNGTDCDPPAVEYEDCLVDGNWGTWGAWGACDPWTGKYNRTRECNNPPPLNSGATCPGPDEEEGDCPVDGSWGTWGEWSDGDANWIDRRERECNNPPVLNGGADCPGDAEEERDSTVTIHIGVIAALTHDPVPESEAKDLYDGTVTDANALGIISIDLNSPGIYVYEISAPDYWPANSSIDMSNCLPVECTVDFEYILYKKHNLTSDQAAVNIYWHDSDVEDLDLNILSIPYKLDNGDKVADLTKETCRKYWGNSDSCDGIVDTSADCKQDDDNVCYEYAVVDLTKNNFYGVAVEDKEIVHGLEMTVETEDEIFYYVLPDTSTFVAKGWFAGVIVGNTSPWQYPATNTTHPNIVFSDPIFFDHEDLNKWYDHVSAVGNDGDPVRPQGRGWAKFDFDKPKKETKRPKKRGGRRG